MHVCVCLCTAGPVWDVRRLQQLPAAPGEPLLLAGPSTKLLYRSEAPDAWPTAIGFIVKLKNAAAASNAASAKGRISSATSASRSTTVSVVSPLTGAHKTVGSAAQEAFGHAGLSCRGQMNFRELKRLVRVVLPDYTDGQFWYYRVSARQDAWSSKC